MPTNPVCKNNIPTGAKISWSKATIFIAGPSPLLFVIGKDFERNWNHLNCTGAIIKPYAMNLVNLSKSKGGGRYFESGTMSFSSRAFLESNSIPISSSSLTPPGFRAAASRIAAIDCANVSAIPPSTAFVIIIVRTASR